MITEGVEKIILIKHFIIKEIIKISAGNVRSPLKFTRECVRMNAYSKAANQGYYKVFNCIGLCYNYGRGVESDYAEAAKWFDKAAEKSVDPSDWVSRGIAYMLGRTEKWSAGHEIHRDEGKIYYWFKKAADKGDVDGMYRLGWCYDHGIGVVVNKQEALKWYKKAAELGNAEAIETLKKFR